LSKRKEVTDEIEVIEEWKKSPYLPPDDTSGGKKRDFTSYLSPLTFSLLATGKSCLTAGR